MHILKYIVAQRRSEMTTATKQVGLVELGTMFSQGLTFLDGDIDKSLSVVIDKHEGEEVVIQKAIPARDADEDNGIEAQEETPAIKLTISEEVSVELLGAVAELPQLRSVFALQINLRHKSR